MDGVVAFDPEWFAALFPEFASVATPRVQLAFTTAGTLCDNTPASVITDWSPKGVRASCLAYLTAHVLALAGLGAGNDSRSGLVGRIASASQGSVSVSVDMPANPNGAWFNQTQYGATYWQMTAPFRLFMYVPPAC
jgi:hypothetical protein